MRVAIIGRTKMLLDSARVLKDSGHTIGVVWTDRPESHYGANASDFEMFAGEAGALFACDRRINDHKNVALLREASCDIAISVNWISILAREVRESFRFGVLNAHAGDLPRYRGNACPNWAILNAEPHIGFCIHLMTDGVDEGDILVRRRLPLSSDVYIEDVYKWMNETAPSVFREAVEGLECGQIAPEPQPTNPALTLRCYPRRPEDGRIDWSRPADEVHRLIRASSRPLAGAFTFLEGQQRLNVWRADLVANSGSFLAVPGQVCAFRNDCPLVACADGLLLLTDMEIDGADTADGTSSDGLSRRLSLRSRFV